MKLTGAQIERFVKAPDRRAGAVLVYGPDEGLVRERAQRLIAHVLDDPHDPFRLSDLQADTLRGDQARLADEANALSLMGGRRVVRVRHATDQTTSACENLLAQPAFEAFVVVEAGDLGGRSSLRRLFEEAKNAAAVPCYRDQARDLSALIEQTLAEHGLEADPDARSFLLDHLGADRGVTRSELDKLVLYAVGETSPRAPIRQRVQLADVAAVIGDSSAIGLDDLMDATTLGDFAQVGRCLDRLLGEGQSPVRIVRALATHFVRLQRFAHQVERGQALERVVDQARPPIHFRRRDKVKAALRRWPAARTAVALERLLEAELMCKTTGYPAPLICRDVALALTREAASATASG